MKKYFSRIAVTFATFCLLAVAFFFACGFGDETGVLRWSPSSKKCSQDVNFTGAVTVAGEQLVGTTGSSSITTLGTITTGVWSGTAIAVNKGGTGATTAAGARTNLAVPSVYNGAGVVPMPTTAAKVIGDMYIDTTNADAYICVAIGADTTGWKKATP